MTGIGINQPYGAVARAEALDAGGFSADEDFPRTSVLPGSADHGVSLDGSGFPQLAALPSAAAPAAALGLGIRTVPLSGDQRIDGLLYDGRAWASNQITYSFPDSPYDYEYPYGAYNEPWQAGFAQVSQRQMQVVAGALEGSGQGGAGFSGYGAMEAFTQLDFVFAGADNADLRIAGTGIRVAPAWTYLPATQPYGGDTWFVTGVPGYDFTAPVLGGYHYLGHLHELTHSVGLKDGHQAGPGTPALPYAYDSLEFTVATYRSFVGAPTTFYRNEPFGYPQSYMMLDIAALQYVYGADFDTRSGNTTYRWNPMTGEMSVNTAGQGVPGANRVFLTIWDGGGNDTYDMSNYTTPVEIDLAPGGWSITAQAQRAVLNAYDGYVLARGNVFNALQYMGDARSLIENARGGAANDRLAGNTADNRLRGGAGNDIMSGLAGADTLEGGAGDDRLDGGAGTDIAVFAGLKADFTIAALADGSLLVADRRAGAPDGADTVAGFEFLRFQDTTVGAVADGVLSIAATAADMPEGTDAIGVSVFRFTVTRTGELGGASSAAWSVAGSGADPADAADFLGGVLPSGVVSFAAGESSATVKARVVRDSVVEADEGFTVTLRAPVGATIATASAEGVIRNDDLALAGLEPLVPAGFTHPDHVLIG